MPQIVTYADTFRDWRGLVGAVLQHADKLPGAEPFRAELEAALGKTEDLKQQQETLEATRLAVTKDFQASLEDGNEKTRKLRAFIKSVLGTRNELLPQFGIPVNRVPRPKTNKAKKPGAKPTTPANPSTPPPAHPPATEVPTAIQAEPAKPGF